MSVENSLVGGWVGLYQYPGPLGGEEEEEEVEAEDEKKKKMMRRKRGGGIGGGLPTLCFISNSSVLLYVSPFTAPHFKTLLSIL